MWNEMLSEEKRDGSEFCNVYLSDAYSPNGSESISSDSNWDSDDPKRKNRFKLDKPKESLPVQDGASTSSLPPNNTIDQVIENVISQLPCKTTKVKAKKSLLDFFKLFVTDEVITQMVVKANRCGEQCLAKNNKPKSCTRKWIPSDNTEMEKFLGLFLWMGLSKMPTLRSYWRKTRLYSNDISKILSRNRFELFLATWHFSDNPSVENDRPRKLSSLIKNLVQRFQDVYTPDQKLCIDETMVPFRGRLGFKGCKCCKTDVRVLKLRLQLQEEPPCASVPL
ncbi:hypothetical protein ILUMI_20263 [Ignelater luminosus]|uniref:PiggyBac transposable element-derived protein domain-containing protein n=1 Tax=Ignelater luminosus TaxID=2038154 RepID=A0A8K0CL90_IGNLU|nr:hypothetical protein ILUMI_20263 [Ignelater luminosus]